MLVLSRKSRESVVVGRAETAGLMLKVIVLDISGGRVRLGFEGDSNVPIHRLEVWERIQTENGADSRPQGSIESTT